MPVIFDSCVIHVTLILPQTIQTFLFTNKLIFAQVLPQILPFDFGEESINSGDMTSISCSISKGDLPLNISWHFNDQLLKNQNGIAITKVNKRLSALSIESVQAEHAGRYTCTARNDAGTDSYSAYLNVNGTLYCFTPPKTSCRKEN